MQLKHVLYFIVSCYLFSMGVFAAHVNHRIQLNKTFQHSLKELNSLQSQKQELLKMLQEDVAKHPSSSSIVSHLVALEQKSVLYRYDNLFLVNGEQIQLQEFYLNFLNGISKHFPDTAGTAQSLIMLEERLRDQRGLVLTNLSTLL